MMVSHMKPSEIVWRVQLTKNNNTKSFFKQIVNSNTGFRQILIIDKKKGSDAINNFIFILRKN